MIHCKLVLLFIIAQFIFYTCSENTSSVSEKEKEIEIEIISNNKKIGSIIRITGFDSLLKRTDYLLAFSGVDYKLYPDSVNNYNLYTHIPFGAITGQLKILVKNEVIFSDTIIVSEESPDSVIIKWFDLSYEINERDAFLEGFSGLLAWQGTLSEDTVSFSITGLCGDECNFIIELKLKEVQSLDLPEFVSLIRTRSDYYSGIETDTLKAGIVKIQDYDLAGVVSGKVFSEYWEPRGLTFWYDFSHP